MVKVSYHGTLLQYDISLIPKILIWQRKRTWIQLFARAEIDNSSLKINKTNSGFKTHTVLLEKKDLLYTTIDNRVRKRLEKGIRGGKMLLGAVLYLLYS